MQEIEAKLLVPDKATYHRLMALGAIGSIPLRPRGSRLQQDVYVDTQDMAVYRAGYGCRLRTISKRSYATLKGLGGASGDVHAREELETELPEPSLDALLALEAEPGPRIRAIVQHSPLRELFRVITRRRLWDAGEEGTTQMELALDQSTFVAGQRQHILFELELELREGDRAALEEAARILRERFALAPSRLSKFERGLRLAGLHPGDNDG